MGDDGVNGGKTRFADYIIFGLSRDVNTELVKFDRRGLIIELPIVAYDIELKLHKKI